MNVCESSSNQHERSTLCEFINTKSKYFINRFSSQGRLRFNRKHIGLPTIKWAANGSLLILKTQLRIEFLVLTNTKCLANEFWNRLPVIHNRCGATVEVFNEDLRRIDTQVMVYRGEEIPRHTDSFNRIFTAFVSRSDETTGFNSAACP